MEVKLYRMKRQTVCVRMVFAVFRQALLPEFCCPRLEPASHRATLREILERSWTGSGRSAESTTAGGRAWRRAAVPDSGQVRPAIRSS